MTNSLKLNNFLSAVFALLLTAASGTATPVYDTLADYSGTRSVANGQLVVIGPDNDEWDDGQLTWLVVPEGSLLRYTYTFSGFNRPSVSHFTLDLSDNCTITAGCVSQAQLKDGTGSWVNAGLEFGNKDGINGAVKFDIGGNSTSVTYSFLSARVPVYGDFYMKSGGNNLQNAGFGDRTSTDVSYYIARPDTVSPSDTSVPEPGAMALVGSGMLFAGFFLRRRAMRG